MDVEMQAPHGDTDNKANVKKACCIVGIPATVVLVILACILVPVMYFGADTQYSVGIDSISGLDPATGLSFDLTLTVTSRSHGAKACVNPGMIVEIFYRGVQLAYSEAETQWTCAGPRNAAQRPVVARAMGVPLGHVLESLETDMRQGTAVFDVRLDVPAESYGGIAARASWLINCKGARVGDAAVLCESPDQS